MNILIYLKTDKTFNTYIKYPPQLKHLCVMNDIEIIQKNPIFTKNVLK